MINGLGRACLQAVAPTQNLRFVILRERPDSPPPCVGSLITGMARLRGKREDLEDELGLRCTRGETNEAGPADDWRAHVVAGSSSENSFQESSNQTKLT